MVTGLSPGLSLRFAPTEGRQPHHHHHHPHNHHHHHPHNYHHHCHLRRQTNLTAKRVAVSKQDPPGNEVTRLAGGAERWLGLIDIQRRRSFSRDGLTEEPQGSCSGGSCQVSAVKTSQPGGSHAERGENTQTANSTHREEPQSRVEPRGSLLRGASVVTTITPPPPPPPLPCRAHNPTTTSQRVQ